MYALTNSVKRTRFKRIWIRFSVIPQWVIVLENKKISKPIFGTGLSVRLYNNPIASVAQWIEQPPPKGQVGRSIRLRGANRINRPVARLSSASYPIFVYRITVCDPRFPLTLGQLHAVALHVARYDRLATGLSFVMSAPKPGTHIKRADSHRLRQYF